MTARGLTYLSILFTHFLNFSCMIIFYGPLYQVFWHMRRQLILGVLVRPFDIKAKTRPGNVAKPFVCCVLILCVNVTVHRLWHFDFHWQFMNYCCTTIISVQKYVGGRKDTIARFLDPFSAWGVKSHSYSWPTVELIIQWRRKMFWQRGALPLFMQIWLKNASITRLPTKNKGGL